MTDSNLPNRKHYVAEVVRLYLSLPETPARAGVSDRQLAGLWFDRHIEPAILRQAFLLASIRRLGRSPEMPPLAPIRSLHYFMPVVEEILQSPLPPGYADHLERKLRTFSTSARSRLTNTPAPV